MKDLNHDLIDRVWDLASKRHSGQTYGSIVEGERIEYMTHIGRVALETSWALSLDGAADPNLALPCAILHDTIEDTGTSHAELAEAFGSAIADGVLALSKDERLPGKGAQMADSLRRIRLQPREVWMVKLADRIANLGQPPHYWSNEKILAYRDEAVVIREALGTASADLALRLDGRIEAYPRFVR